MRLHFILSYSYQKLLINIIMENMSFQTPKKTPQDPRQSDQKFVRKPSTDSSRSHSRKSSDSTIINELYIKTPKHIKKGSFQTHSNFFSQLADELNSRAFKTQRKQKTFKGQAGSGKLSSQETSEMTQGTLLSDYKYGKLTQNWAVRINILEAEIDVKNHELSTMSDQLKQISMLYQSQKNKRVKKENDLKALREQLNRQRKKRQRVESQNKRVQSQRQYLFKQIEFLQQLNLNESTKTAQSYKEQYLQGEVEELKNQLKLDKTAREQYIEKEIQTIKEQYYTLQSEYKAMKLANEVLLKKLHCLDEQFHEMVLQSKEYNNLKQKYMRLLNQYKKVRIQYWSLKAQVVKNENNFGNSEILELTLSETDHSGICYQQQ